MVSAFKVASRVVMLYQGRIIFSGTPDQARSSDDERLSRFIAGTATDAELAALVTEPRTRTLEWR
jgi:ABC-type transporter Mla maintaining outer membrane lipid asymmetry ATPase subunit MlaF